jgi:hypothetical protein
MREHRVGHRHALTFRRTRKGSSVAGATRWETSRGAAVSKRDQPTPASSNPWGADLEPTFGCNRINAREGPGRESDPTAPGGKPLERRKPRRARACRSAKPRAAGTASRREQYPVGGFPCSFFVSLTWNQPRTIQTGWRWSDLRLDLPTASAEGRPDLTATPDPVAPCGPASQGAAAARCQASGRDTELHRVAARPPVPPHVGSHDAPRRVAPPQAPWRSSGARIGKPSRVHPGTWRHVRCHLRVTPSRPPR